tara:strand:- start:3875 stop:4408 length:534 start_codon:yes stop_codon:yes gene_type:complete
MPKNLNLQLKDDSRRRLVTFNTVSLMFDGSLILKSILKNIKRKDTVFVVGCVAWLSNKRILSALSKKQGVCFVCTKDKLLKRKSNRAAFKLLKPCFPDSTPIRTVGAGRGRLKSLLHHKFIIGCSEDAKPLWVMNGSFNMTESAMTNIENMMLFEDEEVAQAFYEEFCRVFKISKKC